MGLDCSSMGELILAQKLGLSKDNLTFTSNNTSEEEFLVAHQMQAQVTFDDISHVPFYEEMLKKNNLKWNKDQCFACRYNPGKDVFKLSNSSIIGDPSQAKFGMTREQIFSAYKMLKNIGITKFGIHCMTVSNELNSDVFVNIFQHLLELATEISQQVGIQFEFINYGGGIGIPYTLEQKPVDLHSIVSRISKLLKQHKMENVKIYTECGRFVTGPHGFLITRVRHMKHTYKNYICVDSNINDLMRPALYGAYHHITVIKHTGSCSEQLQKFDVVGSLCENNDKFAIDRMLPSNVGIGDILVIHDAGAHCQAMSFNYNSKLRCAEYLLASDSSMKMIRRAETYEDLFRTLV